MSDSAGKGMGKGLFALVAVVVVAAGVALGMFVWPMLTKGEDSPAAAGYVSSKDMSADSTMSRETRESEADDDSNAAEDRTAGDSSEPAETSTPARDERSDEQDSGRDQVASNNNTARNGGGGGLCDGRAVLILHSVVDYGNAQSEINSALAQYPGTQVLQPGACSSLRASLDGHQIYAIVRDYGNDIATLCRDAAVQGGNPRTLNNNADFASPCG